MALLTALCAQIAEEEFGARGLMVLERNYLDIYTWEKWSTNTIPTFQRGQAVTPTMLRLQVSQTAAPGYLTESDLIGLMDREGIGTDATIAEHIKTILDRKYAEKTPQNQFVPTTLGSALLDGYDQMELAIDMSNPKLRVEMERDMQRISSGEKTQQDVITTCCTQLHDIFQRVRGSLGKLDTAVGKHFGGIDVSAWRNVRLAFSRCGVCNNMMALKKSEGDRSQRRV